MSEPGDPIVAITQNREEKWPTSMSVAMKKSPVAARSGSPFFGRLEVPVPRVSCQGLRAMCGDGVGVSQIQTDCTRRATPAQGGHHPSQRSHPKLINKTSRGRAPDRLAVMERRLASLRRRTCRFADGDAGSGADSERRAPARRAAAARSCEQAAAASGWRHPLVLSTTPADAGSAQARRALEVGADLIITAGGDGTVRACAEVLAGGRRQRYGWRSVATIGRSTWRSPTG